MSLKDLIMDAGHEIWLGRSRARRGEVLYYDASEGFKGSYAAESSSCGDRMQASAVQPKGASRDASQSVVRCVCLSDLHERHLYVDVPPGDLLLVSGDMLAMNRHFTTAYATAKIRRIAAWIGGHPHPHKVVIAGNHDLVLETIGTVAARALFAAHGVEYLEESGTTLDIGSSCAAAPARTAAGRAAIAAGLHVAARGGGDGGGGAAGSISVYGSPASVHEPTSKSKNLAFQQNPGLMTELSTYLWVIYMHGILSLTFQLSTSLV